MMNNSRPGKSPGLESFYSLLSSVYSLFRPVAEMEDNGLEPMTSTMPL